MIGSSGSDPLFALKNAGKLEKTLRTLERDKSLGTKMYNEVCISEADAFVESKMFLLLQVPPYLPEVTNDDLKGGNLEVNTVNLPKRTVRHRPPPPSGPWEELESAQHDLQMWAMDEGFSLSIRRTSTTKSKIKPKIPVNQEFKCE
ncbi:hypothetical protein PsorP6_006057 [Peronosclerospora sorghi]|uniref:Uncharacterized protein n=1 Tax=Peronosclerospora sorghi TaxID=230839 RepID=A0ACC0W6A4_9STRA|nr:hypothetical protein PsorP6_006057 [Peronosclerospora sorghi]